MGFNWSKITLLMMSMLILQRVIYFLNSYFRILKPLFCMDVSRKLNALLSSKHYSHISFGFSYFYSSLSVYSASRNVRTHWLLFLCIRFRICISVFWSALFEIFEICRISLSFFYLSCKGGNLWYDFVEV